VAPPRRIAVMMVMIWSHPCLAGDSSGRPKSERGLGCSLRQSLPAKSITARPESQPLVEPLPGLDIAGVDLLLHIAAPAAVPILRECGQHGVPPKQRPRRGRGQIPPLRSLDWRKALPSASQVNSESAKEFPQGCPKSRKSSDRVPSSCRSGSGCPGSTRGPLGQI
jgi:hypothetical protein